MRVGGVRRPTELFHVASGVLTRIFWNCILIHGKIGYATIMYGGHQCLQAKSSGSTQRRAMVSLLVMTATRMFLSTSVQSSAPASSPSKLSLIHISEPTRLGMISYAVFCLKKK